MSIVVGMPSLKGNSEVIDSFPLALDSNDAVIKVQPGTPAFIDDDGTLAACVDDSELADGIAGVMNADGLSQGLIRTGLGVGVVVEEGLDTAVGEQAYLDAATGQITNDPDLDSLSVPQNVVLNAFFASASDGVAAYDPNTKAELATATYEAALIDFPGGLK
jgi:hypothetical protein